MTTFSFYSFRIFKISPYINFLKFFGRILAPPFGRRPGAAAPPRYATVARIWQGGGQENFFFKFGNLHVAMRHDAHGEAMHITRWVRGHAPPNFFFKWCNLVRFGVYFEHILSKKFSKITIIYIKFLKITIFYIQFKKK